MSNIFLHKFVYFFYKIIKKFSTHKKHTRGRGRGRKKHTRGRYFLYSLKMKFHYFLFLFKMKFFFYFSFFLFFLFFFFFYFYDLKRIEVLPLLTQRFFKFILRSSLRSQLRINLKNKGFIIYIKKGYIFSTVYIGGGGYSKKNIPFFHYLKKVFSRRRVIFFSLREKENIVFKGYFSYLFIERKT